MRDSAANKQVKPCIAELLRTCTYPPSLRLRIDHIVKVHPAVDNAGREPSITISSTASRLFLTDEVLTIQAVIKKHLNHDTLQAGDVLDLRDFELRRTRRTNGNGKVIYIGINDCYVINSEDSTSELEGGFIREDSEEPVTAIQPRKRSWDTASLEGVKSSEHEKCISGYTEPSAAVQQVRKSRKKKETGKDLAPSSQESDNDFETFVVDTGIIQQRRRVLRDLEHPVELATCESTVTQTKQQTASTPSTANQPGDLRQTNESHTSQISITEAPFHTLASLLRPDIPLPRRNYVCSVLAVVSWVSESLIHRPNSPFPPKRHLKLHDMSIAGRHAGITLAVFVNAKAFVPNIGTIALFRGVVMQRWEDEVILNAYKDLGKAEDAWCITDKHQLRAHGCDVSALENWWNERSLKLSKHSQT